MAQDEAQVPVVTENTDRMTGNSGNNEKYGSTTDEILIGQQKVFHFFWWDIRYIYYKHIYIYTLYHGPMAFLLLLRFVSM